MTSPMSLDDSRGCDYASDTDSDFDPTNYPPVAVVLEERESFSSVLFYKVFIDRVNKTTTSDVWVWKKCPRLGAE